MLVAGLVTQNIMQTAQVAQQHVSACRDHATRFTNPNFMGWGLAIGYFLSLAALEEIIFRGEFFLLFLRPPVNGTHQFAPTGAAHAWIVCGLGATCTASRRALERASQVG